MTRTLQSEGILPDTLFRVEGDLVENYNRSLEAIIGERTKLTSFRVDKRGESPEIQEELGENHYLQCGSAHRYAIVVSPSQKNASLIHEEFSFDNEVLDFLYNQFMPGVSMVTRVDSLYGELDGKISTYTSPDSLMMVRDIDLELHTPSQFIRKATELQRLVSRLEKDASLLIKNNYEVPTKILGLVKEVGDVRGYNISGIKTKINVESFYTRLFNGIYVFRRVHDKTGSIGIKRPGKPIQEDSDLDFLDADFSSDTTSANALQHAFKLESTGRRESDDDFLLDFGDSVDESDTPSELEISTMMGKKDPRLNKYLHMIDPKTGMLRKNQSTKQKSKQQKDVVIYFEDEAVFTVCDGPGVDFIPIQMKDEVLDFLEKYEYTRFNKDLIEHRLERLEDITLLNKGYDVANMSSPKRSAAIDKEKEYFPEQWRQLMVLKTDLAKGNKYASLMKRSSANVRAMLMEHNGREDCPEKVVEHLLTKLWPTNYELMYECNTRDLEKSFESADNKTQNYIVKVLKEYISRKR